MHATYFVAICYCCLFVLVSVSVSVTVFTVLSHVVSMLGHLASEDSTRQMLRPLLCLASQVCDFGL